ncbi:uncharacterized protein A4U43_C05F910 [Asparagus officinalis]|uniref:Uncharacterized protein n=1 Tax=Asparagus officinalis TaxID=4686 RepID=A0A5P1ENE3_ASPOF|nr:uncharacterized protein A4U43_C07F11490 [Asparagus officinalis]ONK67522.1 uncharacterized protein A4U43_C05F910 [Asparagus officinalis]
MAGSMEMTAGMEPTEKARSWVDLWVRASRARVRCGWPRVREMREPSTGRPLGPRSWVAELKGDDVVCVIKNTATLAGSLFTLHISQIHINLPTLTDNDKDEQEVGTEGGAGGAAEVEAENNRTQIGQTQLRGPRGLPVLGSLISLTRGQPHRTLARLARTHKSTQLLAFSVGSIPAVISIDPAIAKEILTHPNCCCSLLIDGGGGGGRGGGPGRG